MPPRTDEVIAVPRRHVADDAVELRPWDAVAREHAVRRERAGRDVIDALRHGRRIGAEVRHRGKSVGLVELVAVHLEGGGGGRQHREPAVLRARVVEGADVRDVAAGRLVHRDERAAQAELAVIERHDGADQHGIQGRRDGLRQRVHHVRRGKVEVELEQGGRARRDHDVVRVFELELDVHDTEGIAILVHDRGRGRNAQDLDAHLGVAVVEAHRRAHVGAVRDGRGRDELGDVHQIREIHPLAGGERLDGVAIGLLELDRDHVHGIGEEVAFRVGQADHDLAAAGRVAGRGRVVAAAARGQDGAAAVAAGGEGEEGGGQGRYI